MSFKDLMNFLLGSNIPIAIVSRYQTGIIYRLHTPGMVKLKEYWKRSMQFRTEISLFCLRHWLHQTAKSSAVSSSYSILKALCMFPHASRKQLELSCSSKLSARFLFRGGLGHDVCWFVRVERQHLWLALKHRNRPWKHLPKTIQKIQKTKFLSMLILISGNK